MSRPLRSIMVAPRWLNTKPAPAAITRPMPAITANAANRLPRRPHFGILKRGRKRPRPRLRRIAIEIPPRVILCFRRGVSLGQVKKSQVAQSVALVPQSEKRKGRQRCRPSITKRFFEARSVARGDRARPVEAVVNASLKGVVVGREVAGAHQR